MKKYLLLFSIASLCMITSQAQIKKGAIFLGGDISGGYSNTKSADTTYRKNDGINIGITYGKAIRENLVFGVAFSANINTQKYMFNNGARQKTSGYSGGIFLRKYKQLGSSGFYIFANSNLGASFSKYINETLTYPSSTKTTTISVTAYPGISYSVSRRFQLETGFNNFASISYYHEKSVNTYQDGMLLNEFKTNGFNAGVSLNNLSSLYLGFRVLLN
jgi:hypothetical protein